MIRRVGRQGASILLAAVIGLGCAGTRERPTGDDAAAAGAAAGGHAGGSPAGTGGSATDGPGRVIGGDALGEMACASASQKAQQVPLDLYFMIDSSGSMADTTSNGQTKWAAVVGAMKSFLEDPQSAGLGVGVQYFPLVNASVPDSCNVNGDCGSGGPCGVITTCSQPTSGTVTPCASNADCRGQGTCVRLGACGPANAPLACAPPGPASVCSNGYVCTALAGYCNGRDKCDVASYATPAVE